MHRAMKKPSSVPAQIWMRMRLMIVFLVSRSSFSVVTLSEGVSPLLEAEGESARRGAVMLPVIINCSTNESRTETMMAASIVSPDGQRAVRWEKGHVRKTMKKMGTEKRSRAMVGNVPRWWSVRSRSPTGSMYRRSTQQKPRGMWEYDKKPQPQPSDIYPSDASLSNPMIRPGRPFPFVRKHFFVFFTADPSACRRPK